MSVWISDEKLLIFASLICPSKMILFEKKYQTFDTVFHHQMKHLEVHQKYSAERRIFSFWCFIWWWNTASHVWYITWNTLSCIDPVLPVMVYSEYTHLDEFSSIMFMFIHYLTSSVRALFHLRPATPGHLGWGLGSGLCPISVKKKPHYWNKTHIQSYVYFSRPCLLSHIQSWNYQKICVGVFWGQYIFGARILFWKAPWGLRPCHLKSGVLFLGCVYFCFIKKLYKY